MKIARIVALGVAILVLAALPIQTVAQTIPGQLNGILATGFGVASEPTQAATIQVLLGSNEAFGMSSGMVMVEPGDDAVGTPQAMGPGLSDPFGRITEESLAAMTDAIVAAGVGEDAIETTFPPSASMFGVGGPEVAELTITIDQPIGTQLQDLVISINDAAPAAGLAVLHVGASCEAANRANLLQQARDMAIADARERAEGLAASLGTTLGSLIQASETPYFGSPEAGTCQPAGTDAYGYGPYGPGTLAAFDPGSTEACVSVQVTLTTERERRYKSMASASG